MNWREKAFLRPHELAEVSGRSIRTIQRKIAAGIIESVFEDGCRLIPIRAALRFVGEDPGNGTHTYSSSPSAARKAAEIIAHFQRKHG